MGTDLAAFNDYEHEFQQLTNQVRVPVRAWRADGGSSFAKRRRRSLFRRTTKNAHPPTTPVARVLPHRRRRIPPGGGRHAGQPVPHVRPQAAPAAAALPARRYPKTPLFFTPSPSPPLPPPLPPSRQLPTRINTLIQYENNPDKAQSEIRRVMADLSTAKQRVSDMEMANRSIPEPTRRELGNKIRTYKDSLATLQKDLKQAEDKFSRNALMAGSRADRPLEFDKSTASRDRMQQQTDKLRGGTDVLNDANRRIEETLDVGVGIMGELDRNRETLNRIRGNVSTSLDHGPLFSRRAGGHLSGPPSPPSSLIRTTLSPPPPPSSSIHRRPARLVASWMLRAAFCGVSGCVVGI
jgi:hypothetical protein